MSQKLTAYLSGYGVAALSVAAAGLLTHVLWPSIAPASTSMFFAAVMCASWFGGVGPGLVASFWSLLLNDYFFVEPLHTVQFSGANLTRAAVFIWVALLISLLNGVRKRLHNELQAALTQVKLLNGLLPICADCKKIRDEQGRWWQMEVYISEHSEARFSHGCCPDCFKRQYPQSFERYSKQHLEGNNLVNPRAR
jgi:K+-sensing histidine kinase KdpD